MKQNTVLIAIIVALVSGGVAFAGGIKYQEDHRSLKRGYQFDKFIMHGGEGKEMGMFFKGHRMGFRPVAGEIVSTNDTSITVKMEDGSTQVVKFTDDTDINKTEQGTKADLTPGEQVMVMGEENDDGSVSAEHIHLNPMVRRLGASPTPASQ